ncbi:toxic anion resistance protein, partial [Citrobacter freundii]|nr:toxic anion resistance protein [Citrobacter freundii]
EWVHVQLHQQKGMISLSPPTICNSAVQDTLIQTVGDVVKIQREGAIKLRETEKQVLAMRENLRTRLTQKGVDHGA